MVVQMARSPCLERESEIMDNDSVQSLKAEGRENLKKVQVWYS